MKVELNSSSWIFTISLKPWGFLTKLNCQLCLESKQFKDILFLIQLLNVLLLLNTHQVSCRFILYTSQNILRHTINILGQVQTYHTYFRASSDNQHSEYILLTSISIRSTSQENWKPCDSFTVIHSYKDKTNNGKWSKHDYYVLNYMHFL